MRRGATVVVAVAIVETIALTEMYCANETTTKQITLMQCFIEYLLLL